MRRRGWVRKWLGVGAVTVLATCGLAACVPAPKLSVADGYRTVWGNRRTWPMFLVFFCQYGTLISFSGLWAVPWMRDVYGLSAKDAAGGKRRG